MNENNKTSSKINIKGTPDGIMIQLMQDWSEARKTLLKHLDEQEAFFSGAKILLDVGSEILKVADVSRLRDELSNRGIHLKAIYSTSHITQKSAADFGIETRDKDKRTEKKEFGFDVSLPGEEAVFINRTLRSGYKITFPGNIVVLGDINPGAEVIAGGSILVWGRVRGVVHAGAEGDETAIICALDLNPTQLRIAGCVSVTPERKGKPKPELAKVVDQQIIAETWEFK